jgi:hypothetical protein
MNDQIKLLIAGAVIGIAGAVAGGLVVGWAVGKDEGRRPTPKAFGVQAETHASGYRSKPVSPFASLPKSGSSPTRPGGVNTAVAPLTSASSAAFQKAQDTPEVQKAKAEYLEAQKRYMEAMKKAVEGNGKRVTSDGKAGQATGGSSQPAKQ